MIIKPTDFITFNLRKNRIYFLDLLQKNGMPLKIETF